MAIRAGVGLPGPFFLTFPAGMGILALFLLPAFLMWYMLVFMYYMVKWTGIAFYFMALGAFWLGKEVIVPAWKSGLDWLDERKRSQVAKALAAPPKGKRYG